MSVRAPAEQLAAEQGEALPSRAGAADQVKALAWSRDAVQTHRIADLLHNVFQDEEARYAADTASICTVSARLARLGWHCLPSERILGRTLVVIVTAIACYPWSAWTRDCKRLEETMTEEKRDGQRQDVGRRLCV
jgi:hypothetical protein